MSRGARTLVSVRHRFGRRLIHLWNSSPVSSPAGRTRAAFFGGGMALGCGARRMKRECLNYLVGVPGAGSPYFQLTWIILPPLSLYGASIAS
jgi:hypothetical protein